MNPTTKKKILGGLAGMVGAAMVACPVFAQQATASFSLQPEQDPQDGSVWYELVYQSGTNSTAGAGFYFQMASGVSVEKVEAGTGVEEKEISYNIDGEKLVLLYLDEDGGTSVPKEGGQLFRIQLKGEIDSPNSPFTLEKTDVCAVLENMDIIPVESTLHIAPVQTQQPPSSVSSGQTSQQVPSSAPSQSQANSQNGSSNLVKEDDSGSTSQSQQQTESTSQQKPSTQQPQTTPNASGQDSSQSNAPAPHSQNKGILPMVLAPILCIVGAVSGALWWKKKQTHSQK